MEDNIVAVDSAGGVFYTNRPWNEFATNNDYKASSDWTIVNYLSVCDKPKPYAEDSGLNASNGIRKVIQGELSSFHLEYPCNSPTEKRWFIMRVIPVKCDHMVYYVISHSDITDRKKAELKLVRSAQYDLLTNLPNRMLLDDRLSYGMAQCKRLNHLLAVAYLDLDGFKAVNDTYGHSVGDELLVSVLQRMKESLREGYTLARIGSDKFIAVIVDLEKVEDSEPVLDRLLKAVAEPVNLGESPIQVTASIGVSLYPQDCVDVDQLIRHADQAMYVAKEAGKHRYHLFDIAKIMRSRFSDNA